MVPAYLIALGSVDLVAVLLIKSGFHCASGISLYWWGSGASALAFRAAASAMALARFRCYCRWCEVRNTLGDGEAAAFVVQIPDTGVRQATLAVQVGPKVGNLRVPDV